MIVNYNRDERLAIQQEPARDSSLPLPAPIMPQHRKRLYRLWDALEAAVRLIDDARLARYVEDGQREAAEQRRREKRPARSGGAAATRKDRSQIGATNTEENPVTSTSLTILCDTREQKPPPFPNGVNVERRTLREGDYTTPALLDIARIERKSASDFASTLSHGRERFERELERLEAFRWKAIVVEGELSELYRISGMHPHSILGSIASFTARHDLPPLFAVNPAGAGRLIAGLLRRWEERARDAGGLR